MGQELSRSVSSSVRRVVQINERRNVKEALEEFSKKYGNVLPSIGSSDPQTLLRGKLNDDDSGVAVHMQKEKQQELFLKSKQVDSPGEMPQDLIDFLNDMGPVKRAVDKKRTSSRILEKIEKHGEGSEEEIIRLIEKEQRKKKRQLWSSHSLTAASDIEGDKEKKIGRSNSLFLSAKNNHNDTEEDVVSFDEEELVEVLQVRQEGKDVNFAIENAREYLTFPVVMRDTDDELVGVWPNKVNDLKKQGLKTVKKSHK